MKRRLLSLVLAFVMVIGLLPVTALAAQSMTITVQDSSGNPIEDATVVIYQRWFSWNDWKYVTSLTTDAQGTVSYSNDNNNRTYRVVVSADGYNTVTSETFSNSSNEITVTLTATGSSGSDTEDYFYYKFSENSSNSTLYYTTDGSTLQELGRGEELRLDRYAPVAFYVAIAPGYTSGSQFQQRSGSDKYEYDWKGGTYTPIASLTTTSLGSGSNQINITAATELAKSTTYGCDYEFHYSATGTEYRYREFEITGTSTHISVEYSVDGDKSLIVDNNNYRHPNVTDSAYADYLTQITIPSDTPTKRGYTFAGWAFRGGIYRAGDTLQIKDLWSAEINTDVTYTFVAQWTENPSELTITKELSGGPTNLPADFEITVTGSNGYSTTLDQNDEHIFSDGKYTWVLNNLTAATYTVTESGYGITGYTHQSSESTMQDFVYLSAGQEDAIILTNVYQINTYTVIWADENGTALETDENVPHGTSVYFDNDSTQNDGKVEDDYTAYVSFGGMVPTKSATDQFTYVFAGWTPEVDTITGNVTFRTTYTPTTNTYTVTWVDEDGTKVLKTDENVPYGTMPSYNGVTPTKASDAQYHYVFDGWSPTISPVTGDVTYTATYRQGNVRTYTVIWHNYNREAIETDYNVPYGTEVKFDGSVQGNNYANCVSYGGETPTKPADSLNTYEFTGWIFYRGTALSSDGKVVGSVKFEPVFEAVPIPRVATVEVILDGTANGEGQTDGTDQPSVTGTHVDISQMIAGADDAIYLKLADGTGEYITLNKTTTGIYSYSGIANGDYKIYTKVGAIYQQLGIQLIDIDNSNDTDYAPFYSVTYNDGEANGAAVNMPATEYYYVGSHVDVSRKVPAWTNHVFEYWFVDADADREWDEGESIYHPGTSQQDSHLDSSIAQAHTLTASWDDAAQVSVTVVVDHKDRDLENVSEQMSIHLTGGTDGKYDQVAGTAKPYDASAWCTAANTTTANGNSVTTFEAGTLYTNLSTALNYAAHAAISGYAYDAARTGGPVVVSKSDNVYQVTLYLVYDPAGFELEFDILVDGDTPAGLVPAEVDVKVTYWAGDSWKPISEHVNNTMAVEISSTASTTVGEGENAHSYYAGEGTIHVDAFVSGTTPYLYRIEIVNLDAIGTYAEQVSRAATYYTVAMSSTDHRSYTSEVSGFFPAGAYTGNVTVNSNSVYGGLPGTYVNNGNETAITAVISVHPYTIDLDLNYDDQDENTGTTFATIPDRFTVPVLDGYIPTREGHTFVGWYLSADGAGDRITGGEAINQLDTSLAVGGTLNLYAKWDADFIVSGKVEANMGYPCQDTSRKVTVILQRKNASGVYVDWKSCSVSLSTLNGTIASGEYAFLNVPAVADYRIYVPHSAGIVTYQNELSTDYSANHYAVVRGTDDVTTTEKDESLEAIVNVFVEAVKFDLGYMVDASAISAGYRPYNISISLCHDHNSEKYYELIETLPTIAALNEDGKTEIATISVPQYHANGTLFNYVISTLTWQNSKVNNGETVNHVHHLNDAAARKTFAPFVIDYTGPANYSATPNGDGLNQEITLKAIFKPNTYAINYNLNNGSWAVDGSAVRTHVWSYDTEITTTPVREGYVFNGWIASVTDGVEKKTDGTWVVPADIWTDVTLTAQWTPANYTITYDLDNGALPEDTSNPVKYTVESGAITLVNPVREGYTFTGWTGTELNGAIETVIIPAGSTGNRTYTATWTIDSYDITVEVENGTASETGIISVNHGGNLTVTFTANTGYALDSVTVDGEVTMLTDGAYTFTNVTAAHSIKVVYAADTVLGSDNIPDKYQAVVTYMVVNGSFAEDFTDKVKFTLKEYQNGVWNNVSPAPTLGDTIPVVGTHMVPNEGRTTEGSWNTVPTAETAVTRDHTFVWTFTGVQKLNVTYSNRDNYKNDQQLPENSTVKVDYNEIIIVDPNEGFWTTTLVSGTEETYTTSRRIWVTENSILSNPSREHYIFIGWKQEASSSVDIAYTFTAQWEPIAYAITYDLTDGALPESTSNPATYTIESEFTLVNPVKIGYVFEGWTGTGLSAATKEVSVSAGSVGDRDYTATWSAATNTPYTIKYYLEDLNADTFTENEAAQVHAAGTTDTEVSVTSENFKQFDGFTFDSDNENNLLTDYIEPDGTLELKLYYTRNTYTVQYVNDDGTTVLQSTSAEYGAAIPGYTGSTPATTQAYEPAQYTCTFDGWTPESGTAGIGDTVIGNMTYKAAYTWTTNTYTVIWKNEDGAVLETDEKVPYGTHVYFDDGLENNNGLVTDDYSAYVSYGGATPTKKETARYTYTFAGWTPAVDTVTGDVTYTAKFTPVSKGHIASVYLVLNGTYDSATHTVTNGDYTTVGEMLGDGTTLYLKQTNAPNNGSFDANETYPLTASTANGHTVYASELLQNGTYKIYSSKDATVPLSDQEITIEDGDRTRYLFFYSVIYKDGYSAENQVLKTTYYNSAAEVDITDPVRQDYIFTGWKITTPGTNTVLQNGDTITSYITQSYELTAQWVKAAKVNLTVKVNHAAIGSENEVDSTVSGDLSFHVSRQVSGNYVSIHDTAGTKTASEWYSSANVVNNVTTYIAYTGYQVPAKVDPLTTDFSGFASLEGYRLINTVTTYNSETAIYDVTVTLQYAPTSFNLGFKVIVAGTPEELIPEAVDVAITRWDAATSTWTFIPGYENRTIEVTITQLDNGTYGGSGSFTVWADNNGTPYYYRITVVDVDLPGEGHILTMGNSSDQINYATTGDDEHPVGAYTAVVTVADGTSPVSGSLPGAWYNATTQSGTITATVTAAPYDILLDTDYTGGADTTISNRFTVPVNQLTAPTRNGFTFGGWYTEKNGAGTKVVGGEHIKALNGSLETGGELILYAYWKSDLTVSGTVYVDGDYTLDGTEHTIHDADRLSHATVLLQRVESNGETVTVDHQHVVITYDSTGLGSGNFSFGNIADDGKQYRITILQSSTASVAVTSSTYNFEERYQNEPESIRSPGDFSKYGNGATDYMAVLGDDATAVVNAHLRFQPSNFELNYQIDASAIGENFRPSEVKAFILYDDGTTDPTPHWEVISQQIVSDGNGTTEEGQSIVSFADGIGSSFYSVWKTHANGNLYDYAIRLQSITCDVNGDGAAETFAAASDKLLGTEYPDMPFTIAYTFPAYYATSSGADEDQNIILKATLIPKTYTITLDANGGTVNGKDSDTVAHTWSKPTQITAIPVREGYVFSGWTANVNGVYDGTNISAAVRQNVTLTAQWIEIQSVTLTGESGTVTYNGREQSLSGMTVTGLPNGYTHNVTYTVSGTNASETAYVGSFAYENGATKLVIKDSAGNNVTNRFSVTMTPGTLAVGKAELTVTADGKSKTYDGQKFTDFTYTVSGFVGSDGSDSVDIAGNVTYTGDAVDAVNAGSYTIAPVVSGLSADNYTFTAADGTLTIGEKNLTIKAVDKEKVYDGKTFGNFTYTATGFVNGENSAVLSGSVSYNEEAVNATAAGTYEIIPNVDGLTALNYNIIPANGTLTIHADANGDGVADQNQKKVTFKVVNGTWGDGTTEKIVYVTLDTSDVGTLVAPTDMIPNVGYTNGVWETELPTTISKTDELPTYVYKYSLITGLSYTVNYLVKGTDTAIHAQKIQDGKNYGDTVEAANEIITVTGYSYASADVSTLTIGTGENVLNLYYVKDTTQTHSVSAKVQYFYGETLEDAKTKNSPDASDDVVTASGWIGDTVTVTVAPNTSDKFAGYQHGTTEGALSYSVAAGAASDTVTHVVKVYYVKDATQTKELSYTVEYYKDGTKVENDTQVESKTVWVNTPDTLDVDKGKINTTDKYTGYKLAFTDPNPIPDTVAANSVIKVYYVKDDGNTKILSYTVEYYKDGVKADTQTESKAVWVNAPDTLTVDKSKINTVDKYAGYKFVSTDPATIPDTIVNGGVIKVYYEKVFVPPVVDPNPPVVDPEVKPEPPKLNKEDHFAYIIGKDDGLVHPLDQITRAETATIFFRMLLEESRQAYWTQENNFVDVKVTDWFNNAASTLSNAGIMTGRPGGQFAPYANITRGEFATLAVRFFLDENVEIAENNLTDVKGHWAEANINLAYALGLITGYPDNTFKPDQEITRAEAMVIVNRVLERHPDKDHLLNNMITWPDNMDPNVWYYADVQEATNSHLYVMMTDENGQKYEIWQQLLPVRDWAALEKAWSDYNSSHNPGEVVDVGK